MKSMYVVDEGQRATAEALRYEIHRRERLPFPVGTDHARGLLRDAADRDSHVWLALDGDRAIGTIRAAWGAECDLGRHHPEYSLGALLRAVEPRRLVVYDRFLIQPEYQAGLASPLLMKEAADFALGNGIDIAFTDCELRCVDHYERLGFRPYRPAFDHPLFGLRVPMVLLFSDRDHLTAVDSPLRNRIPAWIPLRPAPEVARLVEPHESSHLEQPRLGKP